MASTTSTGNATTEGGYLVVGFLAVLVPLLAIAGSAMLAMGGRSAGLGEEIRQERALLTAEAGIDERTRTSTR